ncbi:TIGR04150 pseudo-rSAM protein [Parabacteroides sp. Marseille-P3160]|uniref:TIGR04150 pseudo-rSAM protein n=1 Tax=Parabacteroides sp. Marseille-P3160 TaxID=1917887 RepID=UPI0009BC23F0|nr:TIGR04150 pseudo-rSAM protein [Parabacteroides sp. Marseille-P3160]
MKKYWLSIFQDVFIWQTKDTILVYNCKNKQSFSGPNRLVLKEYIDDLSNLDNLYTVDIEEEQLKELNLKNWIDKLVSTHSGELVEQQEGVLRPVSLYPYFKLQNDIEHIRWEHRLGIGGKIIQDLHEITVHVNGTDLGSELFSRQTIYPRPSSRIIDWEKLKNFLHNCRGGMLTKVSLVGDIMTYPHLNELISWLDDNQLEVSVYLLDSDLIRSMKDKEALKRGCETNVLCNNLSLLPQVSNYCKHNSLDFHILFPVTSEEEYEQISNVIEETKMRGYDLIPLFNGHNENFFQDYVFTSMDDIQEIDLSKREVFSHQAVNTNFFGKLTILPDGRVYANLNQLPIGTMNDPIYNLLYKEMDEGISWRMIRDQKPCSDCVYQWLCPSPSNYELVIGKSNLCHINP